MTSPRARPERSRRAGKTLSARELARFLDLLRATGNFALACAALGRAKSGLYKRRARDDLFDGQCIAALAAFRSSPSSAAAVPPATQQGEATTSGPSDPLTLTSYAGQPQLRRPRPGTMTPRRLEAFLAMLAATDNLRLAARSVDVAASSIHVRRRRDPEFARAVESARDQAAFALEMALVGQTLAALDPDAFPEEDEPADAAAEGEPDMTPPILGPITFDDALRLLTLHKRGFAKRGRERHGRARTGDPRGRIEYRHPSDEEVRAQLVRALVAFSARVRAEKGEETDGSAAGTISEPEQPPPLPPRVRQL